MKRAAGALVVMAALGGCMGVEHGPETSGPMGPVRPGGYGNPTPAMIPGLQGPYGEGVPVAAPYSAPMNAKQAAWMMSHSIPLDKLQMTAGRPGVPSGILQASANIPGGPMPGMAVPPGGLLAPPGIGPMPLPPGMGGPGMGGPGGPMGSSGPMMAAAGPFPPPGALPMGPPQRFPVARTQVRFVRPSGMKISWFTMGADGKPNYSATPVETPGRYNFLQAAIYRLKLSGIEGRPGLEVYPTLEVVPTNPRTEAFLAHSSVPVEFTNEDFQQIAEGNYVVKVIYLPDPQFQELAATGTDEIVSTRLDRGADPIKEALRRGSILLVIRMGNMDQEAPNTPAIDAPAPGTPPMPMMPPPGMQMMPPGLPMMPPQFMGPGMPGPGPMMPYTGFGKMGPAGPMGGPMGPMGGPMGPMGPMQPMGPMGPMPPMGPMGPMGPTSPTGPVGPMGGQPTGLPGQPMLSPSGVSASPPPTGPTAPAPGTPLSKRDDASGVRQVGAISVSGGDRPAARPADAAPWASAPANSLPTPASLLAIQDTGAGKR